MPVAPLIMAGGMMGAAALSKPDGGGGGAVSTLTEGQKDLLNLMTGTLGQQWGTGLTPYQGQRVAGVSPLQQSAFDIYGGYMPLAGPSMDIAKQALGQYDFGPTQRAQQLGMSGLEQIMKDFDPTRATEMWQTSLVDPSVNLYNQRIIPAIKEALPQLGAKSSGGVDRALARSGSDLAMNLSGQLANLLYQGQQAHLGQQLSAIPEAYRMGMMPTDVVNQIMGGIGQFPANLAQMGLGAGGVQRGIEAEQLGGAQQYWTEAQPYENPWLQYLGTALGTQAVSPYYKQGSPGFGALMAPALGSMLGSEGFWNWVNPAGAGVQASPWMSGMNNIANSWLMGM
jgi:hypothetical protein